MQHIFGIYCKYDYDTCRAIKWTHENVSAAVKNLHAIGGLLS